MQPASLQPAFTSLSRGDVAGAVSQVTAMLESGGLDLAEVMKFGEKLRSGRHFQDSIRFFDHVSRYAPDPLEAHISKAKVLCDISDKSAAMAEVDTIKLLVRDSVDRQIRLFELLCYMKSYSYADEVIKPIIRSNPQMFMARRHYITACLNRGKADWAIAALDEATKATELTGSDWTFAARSYLQGQQPEPAAQAALQAVAKSQPPALHERLLLAQAYVQFDKKKAIRELDAIASQFDGGTQTLIHVADAYLAAGEKAGCREAVGRVMAFYEGREIPDWTKVAVARTLGALDDHEQCQAFFNSIPIETLTDKHFVKLLHNNAYDLGYFQIAGRAARHGLTLTPYDPHYMKRVSEITALGLKDRTVKKQVSSPKGRFRLFHRA